MATNYDTRKEATHYDPVDAIYMLDRLREAHAVHRVTLAGRGELEERRALWELAITTAESFERIIHPDTYDKWGVWAYEVLDGECGAELALMLLLLTTTRTPATVDATVRSWCSAHQFTIKE